MRTHDRRQSQNGVEYDSSIALEDKIWHPGNKALCRAANMDGALDSFHCRALYDQKRASMKESHLMSLARGCEHDAVLDGPFILSKLPFTWAWLAFDQVP